MKRIAVIGATGVVGRKVLEILHQKNLLYHDIVLYASKKSKGKKIKIDKKQYIVQELNLDITKQTFDYAMFCVGEDISKIYVKKLSKKGTTVIDFSSYYRHKYPLIVPQINKQDIKGKILCNPNCSTIGAVMCLHKINQEFGLKRVIYSTYQSVSGAGKKGLDDLNVKDPYKLKKFDFVINNNLIPYIGEVYTDGYTKEENKMIYETKKILNTPNLKVTATCVRVPIQVCHGESINFETHKKANLDEIIQVLKNSQGVKVCNMYPNFPMPIYVKDQNDVFVGRIRKDISQKNCFNMFVVSDNLRKGAAQNGVEILECLLKEQNDI